MRSKRFRYELFHQGLISDQYVGWLNDPVVNQYSLRRFIKTSKSDAEKFVASLSENEYMYAIFHEEAHIGNIHLGPLDLHNGNAEIRILIGEKDFWNKGVATESIYAATKFLFQDKEMYRVGADSCNPSFGKVVRDKLGWRLEGTMKERMLVGDERLDYNIYGILNSEFKKIAELE